MLINRIKEDIKVYEYFFDVIIISDARFKSEIENIKNKNTVVIKIEGKENKLTNNLWTTKSMKTVWLEK